MIRILGILQDICEDNGISLSELTDDINNRLSRGEKNVQGWAVVFQKGAMHTKHIYYDTSKSLWKMRFTVAHELGHHLLGHLTPECSSAIKKETEADIFASVFMALMVWDEYKHKFST